MSATPKQAETLTREVRLTKGLDGSIRALAEARGIGYDEALAVHIEKGLEAAATGLPAVLLALRAWLQAGKHGRPNRAQELRLVGAEWLKHVGLRAGVPTTQECDPAAMSEPNAQAALRAGIDGALNALDRHGLTGVVYAEADYEKGRLTEAALSKMRPCTTEAWAGFGANLADLLQGLIGRMMDDPRENEDLADSTPLDS